MKTVPTVTLRHPRILDAGIDDREFELFRRLVGAETGITLSPQKRHLLRARLGKRLRALNLNTFAEYYDYLQERDADGSERGYFINAVTTNKTDFFREAHHFGYLTEQWAPIVKARLARGGDPKVRIWSAGCSTGEEPYTIAMVLQEALGRTPGLDLKMLASDIDTDALARAAAGVYSMEQAAPIPQPLLARYCLRGRGTHDGLVRVRPELQSLITFRRINLLDESWPIRIRFDVIFCRNVLIYFDRPTQQRILERFVGLLKDDGRLFLGHSESVHGLGSTVQRLGNTIYARTQSGAPA